MSPIESSDKRGKQSLAASSLSALLYPSTTPQTPPSALKTTTLSDIEQTLGNIAKLQTLGHRLSSLCSFPQSCPEQRSSTITKPPKNGRHRSRKEDQNMAHMLRLDPGIAENGRSSRAFLAQAAEFEKIVEDPVHGIRSHRLNLTEHLYTSFPVPVFEEPSPAGS